MFVGVLLVVQVHVGTSLSKRLHARFLPLRRSHVQRSPALAVGLARVHVARTQVCPVQEVSMRVCKAVQRVRMDAQQSKHLA